MMKFNYLKKQLAVGAVISIVLIAIAAGAALYVVGLSETAIEDKARIESDIRNIESQVASYEAQLGKSDESLAVFVKMVELRGDGLEFGITRSEAARALQNMVDKYRLDVISSEIGPLEPLEGPAYEGIQMDIERSEIKIQFQAITDQHVYSFLEEFTLRFPGIIKLNGFNLEREREITSNTLFQVHSGGTPLLVKGGLTAEWILFTPKASEGGEQ